MSFDAMRLLPRRRRSRWTWACASVLAITALWFTPDAAGYVQGRVEASIALSKGRAELRTIGYPRNPRGSFDPETGLVSQTLG